MSGPLTLEGGSPLPPDFDVAGATPSTLVHKLPEPIKRIIGDLSDIARTLVGLDLRKTGK